MELAGSLTPRRIYCRSNICLLCARSFVVTEITSTGEKIEKNFFKEKLRLNEERCEKIKIVIPSFEPSTDTKNGVCTKCFTKIGRAIKMQGELTVLMDSITTAHENVKTSLLSLPSPKKFQVEKRLLRSPSVSLPAKQQKEFPTTLTVVYATNLPPLFNDATTSSTRCKQPVVIAPKPAEDMSKEQPLASGHTDKLFVPAAISTDVKQTKARRSLGFSSTHVPDGKENQSLSSFDNEGQVQLTLHYPSRKKTAMVTSESHQKICKAIFRGPNLCNVEKVILDVISKSNPMEIINCAAGIVKDECKQICKRGSGTILQKKEHADIFSFTWECLYKDLLERCPGMLTMISSVCSDKSLSPSSMSNKVFHHILVTAAIGLHGRDQEMSVVQLIIGLILTHGGCTQMDIERLASIGLSVHPKTIHRRLLTWQNILDKDIIELRDSWCNGGKKYQLVGDNWDKNILPSFRTSKQKTLSIHLFNLIAVVDRIIPNPVEQSPLLDINEVDILQFIPSVQEQEQLLKELTFVFATSVISNHSQMEKLFKDIYPKHLTHEYSEFAGIKTTQYPLGLYDCNENKTQELIRLLKELTRKYVPCSDEEIVEPIFLGGDRLTDERVQSAQMAMSNAGTEAERLEGFIAKIEDFHRLMNFLEAIVRMTYSTQSGKDEGTAYYYRNVLNMRNVKGNVKNSYRPYKLLYYTILDAICLLLFLDKFNSTEIDSDIQLPESFEDMTREEKVQWLNNVCSELLQKWFFDGSRDICESLREIVADPNHPENYWIENSEEGRFRCHHCPKTYAYIGSLKTHETKVHNVKIEKKKSTEKSKDSDQLKSHLLMLFKLVLLHKNLDSAVDMGDGMRSVKSAKYELPIYNRTNKTKYAIGSIHLTALTSGVLPSQQQERLIHNRFINIQGGKNNNLALDEYVEMLNRDSKVACSGYQTVDSIIAHSKEYPHVIDCVKHFESIGELHTKKGFHHLPSYKEDVKKITENMLALDVLKDMPNRHLQCKELIVERNPFNSCYSGLATFIYRHKPTIPFRRLRDKTFN